MNLRLLLEERTGLVLDPARIERAVRERMRETGIDARDAYAPDPGGAEFEALVDLLVVPESWMFRDPAVFEEALRFVRRRLLARPQRPLRILSLPCAGGEEPYSMAMALARAGIAPCRCRIDAFDLSRAAIERARGGRYTRNAFRGADLEFRERHFVQDGDDYLIGAAPRAYVTFAQANIFALDSSVLAGRYDLVFCRNLLIYFDEPGRAQAARILHALLADDGLLLSGYAEAPAFCRYGFAPDPARGAFALSRRAGPERADPAGASGPAWLNPDSSPSSPRRRGPGFVAQPALRANSAGGTMPACAGTTVETIALQGDVQANARKPAGQAVAPTPPADLLRQARRDADRGRLQDAGAACRAVLAALPAMAEAWFLLGTISECAGQPREAERCWRRCVYLDPEHYEALCSLALLYELLGEAAQGACLRRRAARVHRRLEAAA